MPASTWDFNPSGPMVVETYQSEQQRSREREGEEGGEGREGVQTGRHTDRATPLAMLARQHSVYVCAN